MSYKLFSFSQSGRLLTAFQIEASNEPMLRKTTALLLFHSHSIESQAIRYVCNFRTGRMKIHTGRHFPRKLWPVSNSVWSRPKGNRAGREAAFADKKTRGPLRGPRVSRFKLLMSILVFSIIFRRHRRHLQFRIGRSGRRVS